MEEPGRMFNTRRSFKDTFTAAQSYAYAASATVDLDCIVIPGASVRLALDYQQIICSISVSFIYLYRTEDLKCIH